VRNTFAPLYTPLARRLAGVNPNTITLFSLVTGCLAGLSFWLVHQGSGFYFLGAVLVAVSGIADLLDGTVARLRGAPSPVGDFLDHFFDRIIDTAILFGLAFSPGATPALGLTTLVLILLNSYLGTQIEASFGRRYYCGLGKPVLFIGLVAGAVLLGTFPGSLISWGGVSLSLINLFLIVLGVFTLAALIQRLRLAWQHFGPGTELDP